MKMTFAMVARSLFGAKLKDEDIDLVSHTICTVQEFIVRQTIQPYLNPWFAVSGELRRHEDARPRRQHSDEYIKRRRHQEARARSAADLMDARYSDGEGMSDELVLSESMQLLVAGHETSSNGLSWLLYLLSSRPDCLEKVRQEFDSVLGDAPLTLQRRSPFEFATQVIQEALRSTRRFGWSTAWLLRTTAQGMSPYPGGSTVDCVRVRRAPCAAYWQNPESFDPERFTKANEKLHRPSPICPSEADRGAVSAATTRCCKSS
jgi:cytochrome P450